MNQKSKEQAARELSINAYVDHPNRRVAVEKSFILGCDFMVDQASEGFEEWAKHSDYSDNFEKHSGFRGAMFVVWQAAKMSAQKEIDSRDESIKDLLESNENNCKIAKQKENSFYEHCEHYNGIESKLAIAVEALKKIKDRNDCLPDYDCSINDYCEEALKQIGEMK